MGQDLPFACSCGKVRGRLMNISKGAGTQLRCHCSDCRRAALWLGQPDEAEGITYYQTTPDRVQFDAGADQLAAIAWKTPKLVRWYAQCCNAPLFNTLNSPKWAFASLSVARLSDPAPLGPVVAEAFVTGPDGKTKHINMAGFMAGFVKRVVWGRLSGGWRKTPFFDATGAPVAPVRHLTRDDRATANLP